MTTFGLICAAALGLLMAIRSEQKFQKRLAKIDNLSIEIKNISSRIEKVFTNKEDDKNE